MQAAISLKDISTVMSILSSTRHYSSQQRLGLDYKNLPEFNSQLWSKAIRLLQELRPEGYLKIVENLKSELLVLGQHEL